MGILNQIGQFVGQVFNRTAAAQYMVGADGSIVPLSPSAGEKAASRPASSSMMLFPSWRDGQPQWNLLNLDAYIEEGYNLNTLIHSAIAYKGRAYMSAPQRAFGESMENPVRMLPNHPLSKLLARPNPYQSTAEYQQLRMTYLNLAGNAYTFLQRDRTGAFPKALWLLRPDWVYIIPDDGHGIKGYLYRPDGYTTQDGLPILPEDMIHIKFPNPGDPLGGLGYGLSPMTPLAQSGDVDNDVTHFLKKFFENKAMVGGVIKYNMPIDEATVGLIRNRYKEVYGGSENWGDVLILDQSAEYQRIAMNFEEMKFDALDKRNESRILMPFGVPGILIETLSGLEKSSYANKREARIMFWEDTMRSEMRLMESDDQYYLTYPDDGAFPMHDLSEVPALQKNIPELVNAAHKMWSMGTPRDDAYRTVGLNVPSTADGGVGYVPGSMLPVGTPRAGVQTPDTAAQDAQDTLDAQAEQTAMEDAATVDNEGAKARPDSVRSVKAAEQAGYVYLSLAHEPQLLALQQLAKAANPALELTPPQQLHITLAYAPDVDETSFDTVFRACTPEDLNLVVTGTSFSTFEPEQGQPTPLVLNIQYDDTLAQFQRRVCEALQTAGIAVSEYTLKWVPHITLGYYAEKVALPATSDTVTLRPSAVCWAREDYRVVHETVLPNNKSGYTHEEKTLIWKAQDNIAQSHESAFASEARKQFEADKRAILALVTDAKTKALERKASIDWKDLIPLVGAYLATESIPAWQDGFTPLVGAVALDVGNYWAGRLGRELVVDTVFPSEWLRTYTLVFADPISRTTGDAIRAILEQAADEGWSIPQMQTRMGLVFEQWMAGGVSAEDFDFLSERMPPYRTENIARTETTRAASASADRTYRQWGVARREWIPTNDDRTRDSHAAADGQIKPMDEPFIIGGYQMNYPGDMSLGAPLSEVAECRCTIAAIA